MFPAFISAGASLLGGLLGQAAERRNNKYQAQLIREQNAYNAPDQVRARAEAAGFNPLLFVGPGVGQQTATAASSSSNYMGSAIADAGLMLADAVAKRKDAMRLSRMEDQNRRLSEKVQSLTLRPQVGGIYSQLVQTPTIASALGVSNADAVATVGGSAAFADDPALHVAIPDPVLDVGSGVYIGGKEVKSRPGWSPASVWENEYGDVGQAIYGLAKVGVDAAYNADLRFSPLMPSAAQGESALRGAKAFLGKVATPRRHFSYPHIPALPSWADEARALGRKKPKPRPNRYLNYMTLPHGGPLAGFK